MHAGSYHADSTETTGLEVRDSLPQDIPFGQLLDHGWKNSPTITITKTLFTAAETTSTQSKDTSADDPSKSTITGTSTIFNMITITSTVTTSKTPSTSSSPLISTAIPNVTNVTDVSTTTSATSRTSTSFSPGTPDPKSLVKPGRVAGSVIGSMAAFSMIGFLVWYLCAKKQGSKMVKAKVKFRCRKSSNPQTPQLEGQSMEQTRTIMLQRQAEVSRSRENEINAFLATSVDHEKTLNPTHHREKSFSGIQASRAPLIGVAISSISQPDVLLSPRPISQKDHKASRIYPPPTNEPVELPASLMPGLSHQIPHSQSALVPAPLKAVSRPAPIITNSRLGNADIVSPLSPRNMLNAVSSTTNKAWKRASQTISPSAYQRLSYDGHGFHDGISVKNNSDTARNPELELDTGTTKGWI